jgi:hypothetical protein
MKVGGQRHALAALLLGMIRYHCTANWVDPRASLEGCGKSFLLNMAIKKYRRNGTKCSVISTRITRQIVTAVRRNQR